MHSEKLKVLILCSDFPPINSIGAERPYSWYKYFKDLNIDPVVITKNWNSNGSIDFASVGAQRKEQSDDYGTVIRSASHKTPSLWFRSIFGSRFAVIRKSFTFLEQLLSFHLSFFDQHYGIYKEAKKYLKDNKIDAVITTVAPFILFKYGYRLKYKYKIKWIADYRDGWYLNHGNSLRHNVFRILERSKELKYTKRCDLVTTVDPELSTRLENHINAKVQVVYNGFWEFYSSKSKTEANDSKLILNHTGTLTNGQRIEVLLDTLVHLKKEGQIEQKDISLNLIGLEHFPNQINRIEKYQKELKGILKTTPRLKAEEATELNLKADFLINFTDSNLSAIYAKTYNYIACKKPILVIPGDQGLLDELVNENKLGIVLNSQKEIENFILERNLNFEPKTENLNFFTRKNQTTIFARMIHELFISEQNA